MFRHHHLWMVLLALAVAEPAGGAEISKYVPEDTEAVAFVNVKQMLDSSLVKKHALDQVKAAIQSNTDGQKLLNAVGLDPLKDIDSVLVAGPSKEMQTRVVIIITGKFDLNRIQTVAEELAKADPDALRIHTEGNLRIYESKGKDGGNPGFATFLDRNTLIASPTKAPLLAAIKGADAKAPRVKKNLQVLIQSVDARAGAWFAALSTPEIREQLKGNPQTAPLADKVTAFSGGAIVADAVQAGVHIHAINPGSAEEVRRLVEAVKGILAFAAQSNEQYGPLVSDVLEAMKVSTQRSTVIVNGKVSGEVIDKGLKKARQP